MMNKAMFMISLLLPSAAFAAVDFAESVQPILEHQCVRCHHPNATAIQKGETTYLLDTAKNAIRDEFIIPGDSSKSKLVSTMEWHRTKLSIFLIDHESETLKRWIDEGAKWPENVTLSSRNPGITNHPYDRPIFASRQRQRTLSLPTNTNAMQLYTERISGSDAHFEMVPIAGGTFQMGSPNHEKGRNADEGPQKEITIEPFWMGKNEVTWDEMLVFMDIREDKEFRKTRQLRPEQVEGAKDSDELAHPTIPYVEMGFGMGTNGFPAVNLTQHMANKYCQWLSARTGHFYRLPTEAEWEYAARAGTTTAYYWGDDASKISEYAWWGKNADFKYQKVGKKKPNPWGLHDMIGNVAEWTLDQYDPQFYSKGTATNRWNVATNPYPHAVRGGSWDDEDPAKFRSAARSASTPDWKREDPALPKSVWFFRSAPFVGFRVVRPLKVPSSTEMQRFWNSGVAKDEPRMEAQ